MNTVIVVFNKDKTKVLMSVHKSKDSLYFIEGNAKELEDEMSASYRELEEQAGINRNAIELKFVRRESIVSMASSDKNCQNKARTWTLYLTTGVLMKDIKFNDDNINLTWVSIDKFVSLLERMHGFGSCYNYLIESLMVANSPA